MYMRKLVLQMMTTLNGRLDDPDAWVSGISSDLYTEIDRVYASFDTLLVGNATYKEMVAYWPGAQTDPASSATTRSMAHKMNTYKKFVFSREDKEKTLEWNNAQQVIVSGDAMMIAVINKLKRQSGGDIHLAGGARLAQSIIRLDLVDEYHFFVYPVVSEGAAWFDHIDIQRDLDLLSATAYDNGVVGLTYRSKSSR